MILVFWMLSFKPAFSHSSFTFIKRLFSSSLSAVRVVSSAYLRLLIFLPAILITACASSSPGTNLHVAGFAHTFVLFHYSEYSESLSVVSDSSWPHGLYSPWNSPGQNTGVGSLSLLQGIFPTQASHIAGGSLPALLACKVLILFSKKAPDSLPEWLSHFTLPPAIDKRFSFFPSLWLFSLVTGFDHSCSDGCVVIFPYDFLSFFVFLIALVCFSVFVSAGSSWLSAGFL